MILRMMDLYTMHVRASSLLLASQVGMFFALGHSSVVFLACCGIILAQHFMNDHMGLFHRYGSVIGSSVSGTFLLIIGVLNLYTAWQLWKVWRGATTENHSHEEIMGFCLRCCPRLFRGVSKPWHMLLVGFVFGLGFDTSTEVGLLGIVAWTAKTHSIIVVSTFIKVLGEIQCFPGLFLPWHRAPTLCNYVGMGQDLSPGGSQF